MAQIADSTSGKSAAGLKAAIVAAVKTRLDQAVAKNEITSEQEQTRLTDLSRRLDTILSQTWSGRVGMRGFRSGPTTSPAARSGPARGRAGSTGPARRPRSKHTDARRAVADPAVRARSRRGAVGRDHVIDELEDTPRHGGGRDLPPTASSGTLPLIEPPA